MRELGFKDSKEEVGRMIAQAVPCQHRCNHTSQVAEDSALVNADSTSVERLSSITVSWQIDETGSGPLNFDKFRCSPASSELAEGLTFATLRLLDELGFQPSVPASLDIPRFIRGSWWFQTWQP